MIKKLVISFTVVGVIVAGLTVGIQQITTDNTNIIARIINPIAPCACISADAELWWEIESRIESYFIPNHGVDSVVQVLYNPRADVYSSENLLFAVEMTSVDGVGNKLFMVEYGSWQILEIEEIVGVVGTPSIKAEVTQISGIGGNLLQIRTADGTVKLVTFDRQPRIIGEFEIVSKHRNGELELREIVE